MASVILRSVLAGRKIGTSSGSPCTKSHRPTEPIPGNTPNQLETRIKKKREPVSGKNFIDFFLSWVTWSMYPRQASRLLSAKFWILSGSSADRRRSSRPRQIKPNKTKEELIKVL